VVQHPEDFKNLQMAEGYVPQQFDAAKEGISSWKPFGNGIFSFQFVDDPSDADIYVFWTKHFVNKLGMALFQNDIRGYTGKRSFPLKQIKQTEASGVAPSYLRPVVSFLRTTDGAGNPMPLSKMKASAAHEFGHALGIEQHSENPIDLMSVYYGHGVVSPNDAATIRYLYHLTPDYVP
jgi:predicted Zn-dependent protease